MGKNKVTGGVLLGAVASGLAAAALGGAGAASATCASISGLSAGSSGGSTCTSTPTSFAIGIGDNTTAIANGLFTGAIAVGDNGANDATRAASTGAFSLAMALGKNTFAVTDGNLNLAVAQGQGASKDNPVSAQAGLTSGDNLNVALNLGGTSTGTTVRDAKINAVLAAGQGNLAANIGGSPSATRSLIVQAYGTGNAALNVGGNGNFVSAGAFFPGTEPGIPQGTKSTLGLAFNALGNDNTVTAVGPLAIAGAIGKDGLNGANRVIRTTPGLNINGNSIP